MTPDVLMDSVAPRKAIRASYEEFWGTSFPEQTFLTLSSNRLSGPGSARVLESKDLSEHQPVNLEPQIWALLFDHFEQKQVKNELQCSILVAGAPAIHPCH